MNDETEQLAAGNAATVDRLARIEVKLDNMREDRTRTDGRLEDHDKRLDRVERFMWLAVGMAAASGIPDALRALSVIGVK